MKKNLFIFAARLAIFVILGFLTVIITGCSEEQQKPDAAKERTIHKLILPGIVADPGEVVDIKAEFRTARTVSFYAKCGEGGTLATNMYAVDKRRIAVSVAPAITRDSLPRGGRCGVVRGEFLVDESLNPLSETEWGGKREGAEHVFNGNGIIHLTKSFL